MNQITQDLPRIDPYKCTFENPVMESKYMAAKWVRIQKPIKFALGLISLVMVLNTFEAYKMLGGFDPLILVYPLTAVIILSFFWWPEKKKSRYFGIFIATFFAAFHSFQLFMYTVYMKGGSDEPPNSEMLIGIPTIMMFVFILLPFKFVTAILLGLYFVGTMLPALVQIETDLGNIMFALPIPLILLTYNKYRGEVGSRTDFAMSISLDETQSLMRQTLRRYFGDSLSSKMLTEGGEIEGENRWVSISFTDIKSYSTITEHMSPEDALEFLNEYFTGMHEVIKEYNGHILNYIGDAIMIVFGAPDKLKGHESQAVQCAMSMQRKLVELNQQWDKNQTSRYWKNHGINVIGARTGIHTGSVIAGNVGSKDMLQYTTIGDVVNVAARLEQANKEFGTDICFSHEVYSALTQDLHGPARPCGEIQLKGRSSATKAYTIDVE